MTVNNAKKRREAIEVLAARISLLEVCLTARLTDLDAGCVMLAKQIQAYGRRLAEHERRSTLPAANEADDYASH